MTRECYLVVTLRGHGDVPASGVSIQLRKHGSFSQEINTIIHPRKLVRIHDRKLFEPSIINAESRGPVGLRLKNDMEGPLDMRWLSSLQLKLLLYLLPNQVPMMEPGAIRIGPSGPGPLRERDAIGSDIQADHLAIPESLVQGQ